MNCDECGENVPDNLRLCPDCATPKHSKASSSFAAPLGSASPRDWHWSLRSMEIHAGRLCVECGERVPADGPMCEECEIEMMYD